jgi:hypothetical protein
MRFIALLSTVSAMLLLSTCTTGCNKRAVPNPEPDAVAKAPEEKKKPEPPKVEKKAEEKKPEIQRPQAYKGLVYNIHMAAHRPEIQNDLKQIGTFYQIDVSSGLTPTTWPALKESMKTAGRLVQKIEQEKKYVINLKGSKLQPKDILAYEAEASSPAHFVVVRASGEVEMLTFEELAKELGL